MIDDILKLISLMHSETSYKELDYDEEKMRNLVIKLSDSGQFVFFQPGVVMLGTCSACFFGNDLVASDILLYVDKKRRNEGLAKKAVSEFLEWSKSKGAKCVTLGQTTGVNPESFSNVADNLGFSRTGAVYGRRV